MDFEKLRMQMIERQLEPRGILNKEILGAMSIVPRQLFIPEDMRHLSYIDSPVLIDCAQTISAPYTSAYIMEVIEISPNDHILEIGTGSGYSAAVYSEIAKTVTSVEIIPALAKEAAQRLAKLGHRNIEIVQKDGALGYEKNAPYDKIILEVSVEEVPQEIFDQLKEGGNLIAPIGTAKQQNLYLYKKRKGKIERTLLMPVFFYPLLNQASLVEKQIIRK